MSPRLPPLFLVVALACPHPAAGAPPADRYGDPLPAGAVARFGTMRLRHSGEVGSVALSPDGTLIASASTWSMSVWDAATGQEVARFKGKLRGTVVAFAPDGKTLLTGNPQGIIQHWNVATGELVRQVKAPPDDRFRAQSTDFSPDGKFLILGDYGERIRLVDVATGAHLLWLETTSASGSVAVSPDARTVATGGRDKGVRLWDAGRGRLLRELEGTVNGAYAVRFSPDGKLLAWSGGGDLYLWDVAANKLLRTIPEVGGCLAFSPDGKTIASASYKDIRLWDVATGREVRQLKGHGSWLIPDLAFSADGKRLVSGGRDHTVILWDVATGKPLHHFDGHQGAVMCLAFSPDGKRLASGGSEDGTLLVWDVPTAKLLHRCPGHEPWVLCVAYAPDGKTIATGEGSNGTGDTECKIRLWDAAKGNLVRGWVGHLNSVQSLAYSPDGRTLASSGWDARVRLWDPASGRRLHQVRGADVRKALAFAPDGKSLLVADTVGGGLTLYATDTAAPLRTLGPTDDPRRRVLHVGFLPGGKAVASVEVRRGGRGEEVTEVQFRDSTGGQTLRSFALPAGGRLRNGESTPAFSPDGKTLAVGQQNYYDGHSAVRLFDAETGTPLGTLRGHTGAVTALAFSPDGRFLASGSWDTTVLLWEVSRLRLLGLWSRLGGQPEEAAAAARALAAGPEGVVPFVKERLREARDREAAYARPIAELDSDEFEVRERATKELERAGAAAEFALRLAQEGQPSAEVRRRTDDLLRLLTAAREAPVQRLLADLDSDDTDKAQAAVRGLEQLSRDAEPFLRRALELPGGRRKGDRGLLSRRARQLVSRTLQRLAEDGAPDDSVSRPAVSRAVGVLEAIGTTEARRALEDLAAGPAESRVAAEARAALRRLGKPDRSR